MEDEVLVPNTAESRMSRTQRATTETRVAETQSQTQRKRAPPTAVGQRASKRTKVTRRDEDSDEEETGFRFGRRR